MLLLDTPGAFDTTERIRVTKTWTHARIRRLLPVTPDRLPTREEMASGNAEYIISQSRGKIGFPTTTIEWAIGTLDADGVFQMVEQREDTVPHPEADQIRARIDGATGSGLPADEIERTAYYAWLRNNGYPELIGTVVSKDPPPPSR